MTIATLAKQSGVTFKTTA